MLEIIREKSLWSAAIEKVEQSDFYHTYDYHHITTNDSDTPILVSYSQDDVTILLPLLIREIKGTDFFDATSVYGYSGPLTKNIPVDYDNTTFRNELSELFTTNRIVSVFCRLNPFITHQESCLTGMGIIETMGKLVNIDLMQDLQTQRGQYQKRLRTYISKCRSLYTIKEAETDAEINVFIDMYYENMQRVNAKKHYFFNREYFFNLLKSNRFETTILLALDKETKEIMGGAMFIKKNRIVQYHLSGVKAQHLHLNPVKVLIDEMRIRTTAEHYTYFNLGGGLGSKEDSLFQFKSGFSHNYKFFKLWKYIVNEEVYEALVARKNQMECGRFAKNCPNYFPCYRCNPHNH